MTMTLAEQLALAVLKGDTTAALALADLVHETVEASNVPPIKHFKINRDKVRAIFYVKDNVVMDQAAIARLVTKYQAWLMGASGDSLVVTGIERIEFYELP